MVKRTLESTPRNATHWSKRAMAKEMGLSQSTVGAQRIAELERENRELRRSVEIDGGQ
ncbi:hypothetical protein ACIRD2_34230 [Streptomyces sp. NPDC093595]|uniref:hypothetical protein n=1 Tax=Streptomyces sp. NPDC093595 TaxID=3366045 RepID=UPI00382EBDD3